LKRISKNILFIIVALLLQSCDFFNFNFSNKDEKTAVARVNESYLYQEDIESLVNENTSKEDSTIIVNNYIDRWATQQLLNNRAKLNINLDRQKKFDKLVEDYKSQLYTKAYTDALVSRQLDSVVNDNQIEAYFEDNKETFSLNEQLIKLRYARLDESEPGFYGIKNEFIRFNSKDKDTLESKLSGSTKISLNDSLWKEKDKLLVELPILKATQSGQLEKAERYLQLKDSLGVYMIYITDIRQRGQEAPLSYIKNTIKQIILNKRKQDLIKQLRTDITKDAIKNNEFEIYK